MARLLSLFVVLCSLVVLYNTIGGKAMTICSPNFADCLPAAYGSPPGDGGANCEDRPNPEIRWDNQGIGNARYFTVIMDDPTAGYGVHWAVKDIPINVMELPEGITRSENISGTELYSTWAFGYGSPCGGPHNIYRFRVFAMPNKVTSGLSPPGTPQALNGEQIGEELMNQGATAVANISVTYYRDGTECIVNPQQEPSCACGALLECLPVHTVSNETFTTTGESISNNNTNTQINSSTSDIINDPTEDTTDIKDQEDLQSSPATQVWKHSRHQFFLVSGLAINLLTQFSL